MRTHAQQRHAALCRHAKHSEAKHLYWQALSERLKTSSPASIKRRLSENKIHGDGGVPALIRAAASSIAASSIEQSACSPNRLIGNSTLDKALAFTKRIHGATVIAIDNSAMLQAALNDDSGLRLYPEGVLTHLSGDSLHCAKMSVTLPPNPRPSQLGYYNHCKRLGIEVIPFAPLVDGYGRVSENERLVDGSVRDSILTAADDPGCDSIVIMGADGGFSRAATYARRAGKNVFVVSWSGTLHPALAEAATAHITVEELRHFIGRVVH